MAGPRSAPRRSAALAAVVSIALIGSLAATGPAGATAGCAPPAVVPVEHLVPGATGWGRTALAGTDPETFSFEVVGTIPDGWMLGLDAIVIRLTGPASFLARTGGVFFGMSGSPAYVDGRLAGAVSGVFWEDPTFGVLTPAAAMVDLLGTSGPPRLARTIRPTEGIRRAIAERAGVSPARVTGTFRLLPTPLGVSGLPPGQVDSLQERLDARGENVRVYAAAVAPIGTAPIGATPFAPGEPVGVAISYGDASYFATGTATFTCGDRVVAFGHPFFADVPGAVSLGLSGAKGLMVLGGRGFPGTRFALLTEPRGAVVLDGFAGVVGVTGRRPASVPIVSEVRNLDTGARRVGETAAIHTSGWWLQEILRLHLWGNLAAAFGHLGPGSSSLAWTLSGSAPSGPWEISNRWMVSSDVDATESLGRLLAAVEALQANRFEDVTFTGIRASGTVTRERLEGTIARVRVSSTSRPSLRVREVLAARPGDVVTVEVTFDRPDGERTRTTVTFRVPRGADGVHAVRLRGGRATDPAEAGSFAELLDALGGGEHPEDLVLVGPGGPRAWPQRLVVSGHDRFLLRVVR